MPKLPEEMANTPLQTKAIAERIQEILDALSRGDIQGVAHELTVHQVELEMQYDDLRLAEERLQAIRQKFTDYFMSAPIGYVILDEAGKIQEINLSAQGLLGGTQARLTGKPFLQFVQTSDLSLFRDCCERAIKDGTVETCAFHLRTTGGIVAVMHAWIMAVSPRSPYRNDRLRISLLDVSALSLDDSRMKRLDEHLNKMAGELLTSDQEISALALSLSRDMQVCMRNLEKASCALQEICGGHFYDERGRHAASIEKYTRLLTRITGDFLQVVSIGQSPMSIVGVDLAEIATGIIAELRARQPERQVQVKIAPEILARGDGRLLEIVVRALLTNAWEAVSGISDPCIEFGSNPSDQHPVYYVRRNGSSLDSQEAEKLLLPYVLLRSSGDGVSDGLGLALAARIVQRHGGRIWAAPGHDGGESFFFTLWSKK